MSLGLLVERGQRLAGADSDEPNPFPADTDERVAVANGVNVGGVYRLNYPAVNGNAWRSRGRLVRHPTLILCDEPTGNLDTTTGERILDLFDDLHADSMTIVDFTHDADVATRARRRLELHDGAFATPSGPVTNVT